MSILDKYVNEIVEKSIYLTENNIKRLRAVLPEMPPASPQGMPKESASSPSETTGFLDTVRIDDSKPIPMRSLVTKMMRSLERQASTVSSSNDPRDHKLIIDGYDKLIKMLMKHNEEIDLQERAQAIEEALIQALDQTCAEHQLPELKATFLAKLEDLS